MSATSTEYWPAPSCLPARVSHCSTCGRVFCGDDNANHCQKPLDRLTPFGEIYSYTTVQGEEGAFVLVIVQLSSGPLITGQMRGVPRELRIGLPVQLIPQASLDGSTEFLFQAVSPVAVAG